MKMMLKVLLIILVVLVIVFLYCFLIAKGPQQKNITFGIDFSQMQAENLKLNWKETYLSILDDLKVKNIKLHTQWDFVEGQKGNYYFNDIDWQIQQAEQRNANIIYVVGMKTGRWPECHLPTWANSLAQQQQQKEILAYIQEVVLRYKNSKAIVAWQAENEPLFNFGICPWYDKDFLKSEVSLIKSLDATRPVIISDSGEQSSWFKAASIGDIVGTTMYRTAWVSIYKKFGFYVNFPLSSMSYWIKAQIIKKVFGKEVINVELQAEPWAPTLFYDIPLKEQEKTMNLAKFQANVEFARHAGMKQYYFWGVEWWYWLKTTQHKPEIWDEAKTLF